MNKKYFKKYIIRYINDKYINKIVLKITLVRTNRLSNEIKGVINRAICTKNCRITSNQCILLTLVLYGDEQFSSSIIIGQLEAECKLHRFPGQNVIVQGPLRIEQRAGFCSLRFARSGIGAPRRL